MLSTIASYLVQMLILLALVIVPIVLKAGADYAASKAKAIQNTDLRDLAVRAVFAIEERAEALVRQLAGAPGKSQLVTLPGGDVQFLSAPIKGEDKLQAAIAYMRAAGAKGSDDALRMHIEAALFALPNMGASSKYPQNLGQPNG